MQKPEHWKKLGRKTLYESKFLSLHIDQVSLPNGTVIPDYSVVDLPSGVVIVATDQENRLITQFEYKYAIDKVILNLPSGSMEPGVDILDMAKRELREETGYESDDMELIQTLYEYPSKLSHTIHIVRAKNAYKAHTTSHEDTESISEVHLISPDMEDFGGIFDATYTVSAIALTLPEYLK
jgi:ADP-ribose pyrophosphatase